MLRKTTLVITFAVIVLTTPVTRAETLDDKASLVTALKEAVTNDNAFEDEYIGQVWLASMSTPLSRWIKDDKERIELLTLIHKESIRAGVEPGLVLALIQVESAFNNYAVSVAGARGMMQIMPFWKKEIGREDDNLMDIPTNLRYGTTILAHYIDLEKGSVIRGLARYNGSRGQTWYPKRVLTYWNKYWRIGQ